MNTPFFLISEDKLNANIMSFKSALAELWPNSNIAYSVKSNSLPWLLKHLYNCGVMAEVVSDEEYQLAKLCNYPDDRIIFNGPIKGQTQFVNAVRHGALVNLDSQNDLAYIKECHPNNSSTIGIRVNIEPNIFSPEDISYADDGFRFGFSDVNGEFEKALYAVKLACEGNSLGLHLHCNSVTRSINVYKMLAKSAADLIRKYNLNLSYIDIGGGFFGGIEGKPTPFEYISVIKEELQYTINPQETTLIIEPGSAIIGSVVDLHTSVLDVKDTSHSRIVTTDGSRIYIDPLWTKTQYMYSLKTDIKRPCLKRQVICGYTCMDHDRLMCLENEYELKPGDQIIYHRVGAYSVTFGGMFIRYYPEVYVENTNGIIKVRDKITVKQFYGIQSHLDNS